MQIVQFFKQASQRIESGMTAVNVCRFAAAGQMALCALQYYRIEKGLEEDPVNQRFKIVRDTIVNIILTNVALSSLAYRLHPFLAALPLGLLAIFLYVKADEGKAAIGIIEDFAAVTILVGAAASAYSIGQSVGQLTARAGKIVSWGSGLAGGGASLALIRSSMNKAISAFGEVDPDKNMSDVLEEYLEGKENEPG
jgi:hypothetical protein